ncbi:MAG: amino acid permease [Bacteroides sp. SM1_62]|nr:MAG: amino acid permease [Bacteroides sp. SM1_62]
MVQQNTENSNSDNNEGLKRDIGVVGLGANVINSIVGGGIFVLPAIVAARLGSASILAYLICGILIILIMLCFAETGSRITVSGGAYAYVEAAFGPFAGFLTNSLFWFGFGILSDAAIANAMADILAIKIPWLNQQGYRALFFLVVFSGFAWVNIRGVKQGVQMVKINTLAKLIPLLVLITFGWFSTSSENLEWTAWPSTSDLGEISLILFFAFGGGEIALNTSGEIKNPRRTVPYGILVGIAIVIVLYILIQTVSLGVLGSALSDHEGAPLVAVAEKLMGNFGATLIIVGSAVSIFGAISGDILGYPRLLFAGSRNGLLPRFLSHVHNRFATPYWAIIIYTVIVFIFSITGGFKQLAIISSAALLTIYLGVVLATIKFKLRNHSKGDGTFRIPGGLVIPVLALIAIVWFLSHLARNEALGIALFLGILSVVYFIMRFVKKRT